MTAEAADSERFVRAFAEAPFGIALVDPFGRCEQTNRALSRLLQRSDDELLATTCVELAHDDDREQIRDVLAAIARAERDDATTRVRYVRRDGAALLVDLSIVAVRDVFGAVDYCVVHITDADAREWSGATPNASDDRRNDQHGDQSGGPAPSDTERAQGEFLSRMSHELRTPLNAVLGFAQLLEMGDLREDQREAVAQIMRAGAHLRDLLTDVLEFERAQSGRIVFAIEAVPVEAIVADAIGIVAPLAREHVVAITTDADGETWARADRGRLRQVLLNLLTNAVKYNRAGGSVFVEVERDADAVCIAVADTGRGIAPQHLQLLFTPFERLGAETTGVDGAGVGLPLARSLAEGMGASVDVTSEPGVGSRFVVRLEGARTPDAPGRTHGEARPRTQPWRGAVVLYVDDNDANVALVEQMLQRRGVVRVVSAPTVADALAVTRRLDPDVVLLDLHLPDGSGEDVLRALRSEAATAAIPVVVVSADATPARINELLGAGAIAYVTKPIVVRELFDAMDLALGG